MSANKYLRAIRFILIFDLIVIVLIFGPKFFAAVFHSDDGGERGPQPNRSDPLASLVEGKIAVSVPDTMKYHHNYLATASITASQNDSILLEHIDSIAPTEVQAIRVASKMKVSLVDPTGESFSIKPVENTEQLVNARSSTIWRWNVKPLKNGSNRLIMLATVIVKSKTDEGERDYQVMEKEILIDTPFMKGIAEFFGDNWQWFLSAILIPLAVYWFKEKNKPKPKKYY
jgi:hypothetical protein